jgi:hypothetical protein
MALRWEQRQDDGHWKFKTSHKTNGDGVAEGDREIRLRYIISKFLAHPLPLLKVLQAVSKAIKMPPVAEKDRA